MAAADTGNPLRFCKANIRLDPDGNATVRMAMDRHRHWHNDTILTQIAAEMLGLPTGRGPGRIGLIPIFHEAAGSEDHGRRAARARPC